MPFAAWCPKPPYAGAAVVATIFFPPAAFLMTDMNDSAEVEELRSDALALQSAAKTNNCSLEELDVLKDEEAVLLD